MSELEVHADLELHCDGSIQLDGIWIGNKNQGGYFIAAEDTEIFFDQCAAIQQDLKNRSLI